MGRAAIDMATRPRSANQTALLSIKKKVFAFKEANTFLTSFRAVPKGNCTSKKARGRYSPAGAAGSISMTRARLISTSTQRSTVNPMAWVTARQYMASCTL